jgi:hypothetical protein
MSIQMRQLFRERVAAWQADEAAGKSLADHLVTVAPDPEIVSSDDAAAIEISEVIEQLVAIDKDTHVARSTLKDTAPAPIVRERIVASRADVAPSPATGTMSPVTRFEVPHPLVAPRPPRPKVIPLVLVLVVIATFATLWLLLHRS